MKTCLLLHHPRVAAARTLADQWAKELERLGVHTTVASAWEENPLAHSIAGADLAITFGGDGTILRAARLCAPWGVPILGVKMGRVGFLSEIEPEAFDVSAVAEGKYWIEERTMLRVTYSRGSVVMGTLEAMNEAVIARGRLARVIRLATYIDEDYLTTFVADGAIVATATGSTAYALAAGGPILSPDVSSLVLVPVAPFLSSIKSLVLPHGAHILFHIQAHQNAILTVDGQMDVELQDQDQVHISASDHLARFARLRPRTYFYPTLAERLRTRSKKSPSG